ncbi:MAG TPA: hypothetical protein VIH47_08430 [Solirubrobacterales bacterium]
METMRDAWTDERLDDLNHRVDDGFREIREEFRAIRSELGGQINGVRSELGGQIAALHRTMLQLFGGMIATMIVGFLTILTRI